MLDQVWDMRVKRSVHTFTGKYQVLAVCFGDAGDQVCFSALSTISAVVHVMSSVMPAMPM